LNQAQDEISVIKHSGFDSGNEEDQRQIADELDEMMVGLSDSHSKNKETKD
jgi:hypothetical protein